MQQTSLLNQMYYSQPNRLSHPQQALTHIDSNRLRISQSQVHPITHHSPSSPTVSHSDLWSTWTKDTKTASSEKPAKTECLTPIWKYRLQGGALALLIGLAITGTALGLALGLTKPYEGKITSTESPSISSSISASTSVSTSVTYTCGSLRWNTVGTIVAGFGGYGNASNQFSYSYSVFVDSNNTLYVADYSNHRIQQWMQNATNGTTVAGTTGVCFQNESGLCYPTTVYVDAQQYMYIADNYCIRRWSIGASSGTVLNGSTGLGFLFGLDMDKDGNLYASAPNRYAIMMWSSPTSTPVIVAGGNGWGYSLSQLSNPYGVVVDSNTKTLYTANYQAHTVVAWKVNGTNGTVIAGRIGTPGSSSYTLRYPRDVKRDYLGNLYIMDSSNYRIVMKCVSSGDSALKSVIDEGLTSLQTIALDSQLNIYLVDGSGYRVLKYNRIA